MPWESPAPQGTRAASRARVGGVVLPRLKWASRNRLVPDWASSVKKAAHSPLERWPVPRQDAPLEISGIGPVAEHLFVVVGFDDHELRPQKVLPHTVRQRSQVRCQGKLPAIFCADAKPKGLGAVVGGGGGGWKRGGLSSPPAGLLLQNPAFHSLQGGVHGQKGSLGRANTGMPYFLAKTRTPAMWSLCSWVMRIPCTARGSIPQR